MSINFHLPSFAGNFELNILLYEVMQKKPEYFYDDIKIGSVYGTFPSSLWNGGRTFEGSIDRNSMKEILRQFNLRGIPCRFTFSNPHIREEHLNDFYCNMCLKMGHNGLNEVIVVSPILEAYIRKNYPNYKIISSTCKQIEDLDGLKEELEKDYKLVVLDYNWNNKFDLLENVPSKERCEILINPCCVPNCKRRKEHYSYIGNYHIALSEHLKKHPNKPFEMDSFSCDQITPYFYNTTKHSTHVTPKNLYEKYVPMGFNNFKIEGRSSPVFSVLESYIYYMVKPEYKDEARLFILLNNLSIERK